MPDSREYQANRTLSGFAVRYKNHSYIADMVSPVYEVDARDAFYYEFGQTEEFDEYETESSDESSVTESKGERVRKSYSTADYSHSEFIPTLVEEEGGLIGLPEIDLAVERVTDVVLRKREIGCARRLFDANNYAAGMKKTVTNKWGTATLKQITDDINGGIDSLVGKGGAKLKLLMGLQAFRSLSTNPNVIAAVTPTKAVAQLKADQLAELFGIDEIVVGEAKRTVKLKQKATKENIWGDKAALMILDQKPSRFSTHHNTTFRRKVNGLPISTYLIPTPRGAHNGTLIKVSMTERTAQIINDQAGYLFEAVSA